MKAFRQKKEQAFSMVEVMVVVSIVAIVMTLAVTAYTKSLAKQMVVKAINATGYLRQAIEDYYGTFGYLPGWNDLILGSYITGQDNNSQVRYTNPEPDISFIQYNIPVGNCTSSDSNCTSTGDTQLREIIVIFSNPTSSASNLLGDRGFTMRINLNGGVVSWECAQYGQVGHGTVDGSLLPVSCYNPALNE